MVFEDKISAVCGSRFAMYGGGRSGNTRVAPFRCSRHSVRWPKRIRHVISTHSAKICELNLCDNRNMPADLGILREHGKWVVKLRRLDLSNCTDVSGDIAGLATLINVQDVNLARTRVSGDIAGLPQHVARALQGYP